MAVALARPRGAALDALPQAHDGGPSQAARSRARSPDLGHAAAVLTKLLGAALAGPPRATQRCPHDLTGSLCSATCRCHHQGISYNLICISRMLLKVFINSDKAHVEEALHRLGLQGLLCSQITRTWQFGVQSLSMGNRMDCISKIKTLGLFLSRNTSKLISTGKKLKIVSAMTSIQFKHRAINEQLQCINCLKSRAFENMVRSVSTGLHYLIYGGGGRLLDARPAAPGSPLPLLVLCEFYWWVRFMNDRCQELLRRGN